jgi:hypothetical protein
MKHLIELFIDIVRWSFVIALVIYAVLYLFSVILYFHSQL